jgi:hypothetical protein
MFTGGPLQGSATALNTSAALLNEAAVALGAKGAIPGGVPGGIRGGKGGGIAGIVNGVPAWQYWAALWADQNVVGPFMNWLPHATKDAHGKDYDPDAEYNMGLGDRLRRLYQDFGGGGGDSHPGQTLGPDHKYHANAPPPPQVNVAPPQVNTQVSVKIGDTEFKAYITKVVNEVISGIASKFGGFSAGAPMPNSGTMMPAVDGGSPAFGGT